MQSIGPILGSEEKYSCMFGIFFLEIFFVSSCNQKRFGSKRAY